MLADAPSAPSFAAMDEQSVSWLNTYRPLLTVLGFILLACLLVQVPTGKIEMAVTMRYFMAGFFLPFSFFKLLDVSAFADAYMGYDLLAKRWRGWGFLYPFLELGLGAAYLANWQPFFYQHGDRTRDRIFSHWCDSSRVQQAKNSLRLFGRRI